MKQLNLLGIKYRLVNHNKGAESYKDMFLMTQCKHNIIANSSFSWWAQYLGDYENKIVVSPDRWYNLGIETDIMMDSWIRMET